MPGSLHAFDPDDPVRCEIDNRAGLGTVEPGDDYSNEVEKVKAICSAVHTPQAIAEYQVEVAKRVAAMQAERAAEVAKHIIDFTSAS